jgi:hypothetical protein
MVSGIFAFRWRIAERKRCLDEGGMGQGLGKVAQEDSGGRIDFFTVEPEHGGSLEERCEESSGFGVPAGAGEGLHEPE